MTREQIIDKLSVIFKNVFEDDTIVVHDLLTAQDVKRWDSISNISMIDKVEKEFEIRLKLKEVVSMQNVGDLINAVFAKFNNPY